MAAGAAGPAARNTALTDLPRLNAVDTRNERVLTAATDVRAAEVFGDADALEPPPGTALGRPFPGPLDHGVMEPRATRDSD